MAMPFPELSRMLGADDSVAREFGDHSRSPVGGAVVDHDDLLAAAIGQRRAGTRSSTCGKV